MQNHWCLAAIFLDEKRIEFYDSLAKKKKKKKKGTHSVMGQQVFKNLMMYLKAEYHAKFKTPLPDEGAWTFHEPAVPQQNNSHDCGVFVCFYADYLCDNTPPVRNV